MIKIFISYLEMFYLNTIEQVFLFVEQLDQLEVCLPYSRFLAGIPILAIFQNLRQNSNKTSLQVQGFDESKLTRRTLRLLVRKMQKVSTNFFIPLMYKDWLNSTLIFRVKLTFQVQYLKKYPLKITALVWSYDRMQLGKM